MATRKNGNGNGRESGGVPRWVRLVLDAHEKRMDEMKREHEERMDAHETRMERLERQDQVLANRYEETHQLALKMLARMGERDAERKREKDALARVISRIEGRVVHLEGRRS